MVKLDFTLEVELELGIELVVPLELELETKLDLDLIMSLAGLKVSNCLAKNCSKRHKELGVASLLFINS